MPALIQYGLLVGWTYLVVRVLGFGATLSDRTLVTFGLVGALLGSVVAPVAVRLIQPYPYEINPVRAVALELLRLAVLLTPVLVVMLRQRTHRVLSVADAFLLAFMAGFGFDVLSGFLVLFVAPGIVGSLSIWPPWQTPVVIWWEAGGGLMKRVLMPGWRDPSSFGGSTTFGWLVVTATGHAYAAGLVALALAVVWRFAAGRRLAYVIPAIVTLWLAIGEAKFTVSGAESWSHRAELSRLSFHGHVTAWLALIALLGCSLWEWWWLAGAGRTGPGWRDAVTPLGSRLMALVRGRFREYATLTKRFGVERQAVFAEAISRPALARRLRARGSQESSARTVDLPWWRRGGVHVAAVAGLLLFLVYPGLRFPFFYLSAFLVAMLVWRYVCAPPRPGRVDVDGFLQFGAETTLLQTAVGVAFIALLSLATFPFVAPGVPLPVGGLPAVSQLVIGYPLTPATTVPNATTLVLLITVVLTGIALPRAQRWRDASRAEWHAATLRRAVTVGIAFLIAWGCYVVYKPTVEVGHLYFGRWLKVFFERQSVQALLGTNAPYSGGATAYTIALAAAVVTGMVLVALFGLVRPRVERLLAGLAARRGSGSP
jgi:hypothetical protein